MSIHEVVYSSVCERVAEALNGKLAPGNRALPTNFRGILTIAIDNGVVLPHSVTVEFRPPQPKGGKRV